MKTIVYSSFFLIVASACSQYHPKKMEKNPLHIEQNLLRNAPMPSHPLSPSESNLTFHNGGNTYVVCTPNATTHDRLAMHNRNVLHHLFNKKACLSFGAIITCTVIAFGLQYFAFNSNDDVDYTKRRIAIGMTMGLLPLIGIFSCVQCCYHK